MPSEPESLPKDSAIGRLFPIVLCVAALLLAGLLAGFHFQAEFAAHRMKIPFCGSGGWLDCDSVIHSLRYGQVLGVPVSVPAVVLYAVLLAALVMENRRREASGTHLNRLIHVLAGAICGAAIWFIWLQVAVIGKLCWYCLLEHTIGLVLAVLILFRSRATGQKTDFGAWGLGLLAAGLLAAVQILLPPDYLVPQPLAGKADAAGVYREPEISGARVWPLAAGRVHLSTASHPMLGRADAPHVVIEQIDYACPRCRQFHQTLSEARSMLGESWSVMVLLYPLSHHCNKDLETTDRHFTHSCRLARVGLSVWMADAAAYPDFHDWLFREQEKLWKNPDLAEAEARRRVGSGRFQETADSPFLDAMLRQDVELGTRLGLGQLPGVWVGDLSFQGLPEEPGVLAELLKNAVLKSSGP